MVRADALRLSDPPGRPAASKIFRYLPSVRASGVRPQTRGMQGSVVQNSMIDGLNVVSTTEHLPPLNSFNALRY